MCVSEGVSRQAIRPCFANESELLASIHRQCFPHYWNPEAFNNFFSVSGTHALVVGDSHPQAMMVFRVQYEQADIITIGVLPGFRRQGIARMLVEETMKSVRAMGAKQLFLDVEDGNVAAIELYKGFGFYQINRRKLYYRQKDGSYMDALVMMRKLD